MSHKRRPEDAKAKSDCGSPEDKRRRGPAFHNVVLEVMKLHSVGHLLEPVLEPLIRRVIPQCFADCRLCVVCHSKVAIVPSCGWLHATFQLALINDCLFVLPLPAGDNTYFETMEARRFLVREEVELALKKHFTSMKQTYGKEVHTSETRNLLLQFESSISLPVFTGARIDVEDCSNLKIGLVDALTGQVVCSGPESSAKVEIVVLEGDFDSDESDIWKPEDFRSNIVREREGKKPLLSGDVILYLKDGIGTVSEISFTDNSSWTRSRKFRLGARVVDTFDGIRIREAKTESFIVRDHRGELYKKHHPPNLFDEVWRLEKIGKEGAFHKRLSRERIHTVKDFLILLNLDPAKLRSILGTGMSTKMWEVTVEHARTCVLDSRRHLYFPPQSEPKTGVVFNAVGQVAGLLSECQYVPVDKLSETEKVDAQNLVFSAFKQLENVVSYEDETSLMDGFSQLTNVCYTSTSPRTEGSSASKLLTPPKTAGFDYTQASASSPDIMSSIYSIGATSGLDDFCLQNIDSLGLRYDPSLSFPVQVGNSLICDSDPMSHTFGNDDHLRLFDNNLQPHGHILECRADLQSAVDGFLLAQSTVKAQRRWRKLFNVLKWFMLSQGWRKNSPSSRRNIQ